MTEIIPFSYEGLEVRTVEQDGQPWFVAADIANILDIKNSRTSIALLDDDEKGVHTMDTPGGKQEITIISEAGLYSLILRSRKPEAKQFKRWVTHEVLPTIRRHGMYATEQAVEAFLNNPDALLHTLTALKAEQEKNKQLTAQAQADKPKVIFADAVSASRTSILIGDLAKILKQNGVEIGQKRLFAWLRENGYLVKRRGADWNSPTQYSMERGWFEIKETAVTHSDGHVTVSKTTKVTGKGQQYFIGLFLDKAAAWISLK